MTDALASRKSRAATWAVDLDGAIYAPARIMVPALAASSTTARNTASPRVTTSALPVASSR